MTQTDKYDVGIVGFGPVGAALAGLLGRRGLRVVVFDREDGIYPLPRAAHIDHTGLRVLQELGRLDELLPTMLPNPGMDFVTQQGELMMRIRGDRRTPSGLPASMYFHQPIFDVALRGVSEALPNVDIRLSTDVKHVVCDDNGAVLTSADRSGALSTTSSTWVVACDGAGSSLREMFGIQREDFNFEERWLIYDLILSRPLDSLPNRAVQVCGPPRPHTELPMPGPRFRFEFMVMPGDDVAELLNPDAALATLLAPWIPADAARIERTAEYTFQGKVANSWWQERVFFAGDAAHLMPPFLGQGMCSGLRDASNLAWKLDHVIRKGASHALLATYEQERSPHVRAIIADAVRFGAIICKKEDDETRAFFSQLSTETPDPEQRASFRLPRLQAGPLVQGGGGDYFPQWSNPQGERFDDVLGQRWLVLASDDADLGASARWWRDELDAYVGCIDDLPGARETVGRRFPLGAGVIVVRPDHYMLGVADDLDELTASIQPLLANAGASTSAAGS